MSIEYLRKDVDKIKFRYRAAKSAIREDSTYLSKAKQHIEDIREAQEITQAVAQTIQQQAHSKIAKVVTACLQMVFPDKDYKFKLKFERKRNRTEATPTLIKDGHEITNPYDKTETDNKSNESGGVLDIAGFACQISAIMLHQPALRPIMIMDEPFKNIHGDMYRENAKQMLEKLSKDFGFQLILVSNMKEIMVGKVIEL